MEKTRPVTLHKPKSASAVEYKKLAASLIGEKYNDPRLWPRIKSIFKKDVPKENINRLLMGEKLA